LRLLRGVRQVLVWQRSQKRRRLQEPPLLLRWHWSWQALLPLRALQPAVQTGRRPGLAAAVSLRGVAADAVRA
jgi:hypothetical protein